MAVFGAGAADLAAAVPSIHLPAATPGRGRRPASSPDQVGEWAPGEPDADRGPRTASAPAAGGRTPCPARGARGGARTQPRRTDGMIDDEGRIGLVASVGSGRVDQPRGGSRRPRVEPPAPRSASRSSTTAAQPAVRADAPQGAALESAPERAVAARQFWRGGPPAGLDRGPAGPGSGGRRRPSRTGCPFVSPSLVRWLRVAASATSRPCGRR